MKHLFLIIIFAVYSFALYAGTPTQSEPVKTDKVAIALHLKPSRTDIHRAPSLNTTTLYGYYNNGMLYIDILDIVTESTECIITIHDDQIVTTALDLSQGIFIGEASACSIEIQITTIGTLIGFID